MTVFSSSSCIIPFRAGQHAFCWQAQQLSHACVSEQRVQVLSSCMASTLQERTHRRGCTKSCRGSGTRQERQGQKEAVTDVMPITIESPSHIGVTFTVLLASGMCGMPLLLVAMIPVKLTYVNYD